MSSSVLAWHFVRADRRLRDGQLVEQGQVYRIEGKPVLCEPGFHASERVIDALRYAWAAAAAEARQNDRLTTMLARLGAPG